MGIIIVIVGVDINMKIVAVDKPRDAVDERGEFEGDKIRCVLFIGSGSYFKPVISDGVDDQG